MCRELGEHPADVAIAFVAANKDVTCPIIGPRTLAQLESALRAIDISLDVDTLARLDEIFPGPGGEAPKPTPDNGQPWRCGLRDAVPRCRIEGQVLTPFTGDSKPALEHTPVSRSPVILPWNSMSMT